MGVRESKACAARRRPAIGRRHTISELRWRAVALLPEHLADLRASGLTDSTIGLRRVEPGDPPEGFKAKGVVSVSRLLYLQLKNGEPFYRDKLFPPIADENGRYRKYDQPAGTGCRLYVLEPVV